MDDELSKLFSESLDKKAIIYFYNGFRYECIIRKTFKGFLQFTDLRKNVDRIVNISEIKEVEFLE